ncbi:MAG: hypothetical protein FWC84_06385 [Alphaproteobacteria bacterium]|nr:hypothetical protein [Alphaproteobacteria bacterium]
MKMKYVAASFAALGIGGPYSGALAQTPSSQTDKSTQEEIARALSAAPPDVAREATVAKVDSQGEIAKVLRRGSNGFTCLPGDPKEIGQPAMCEDQASMQWSRDFLQHKPKPTNSVPGIIYMLAGATQRSDSDPYDKESPPIEVGPHWMIMWPIDPKATGLPTTHKPTGAYIMWAGSPYAHLHIMGSP